MATILEKQELISSVQVLRKLQKKQKLNDQSAYIQYPVVDIVITVTMSLQVKEKKES